MSRATVEDVGRDPDRASAFIAQARKFLADAQHLEIGGESAVILYWNACTSAMDEWRRERNAVSYAARTPGAADLAAMQADSHDIVAAASEALARLA